MVESINAVGVNSPSNIDLNRNKSKIEKQNIEERQIKSDVNSDLKSLNNNSSEAKVDFNAIQRELSDTLKDDNVSLEFSIDDETNKRVIKFIDVETEEIVKQFPPEVSLKIAKLVSKYKDQGFIINAKV